MNCHAAAFGAVLAFALASGAAAQTTDPAPVRWQDGIKLGAQVDAGFVLNPSRPSNGVNFGHLFTDRANQLVLNQALLTAQRPTDPKATGYDVGFKVQALYGTDGRYTQSLGELNTLTDSRYQPALVEANVAVHLPWLTAGGIDAKVGQWATPLGAETIDPSTNAFYSHSYIFNFGLPFTHTGLLTTTHATPWLDLYLGVDTGVNTTFDRGHGDNNGAPGGIAGVGLTLLDGRLTVLALTHIGPENASRTVPDAGAYSRYENDLVTTYKATDKLTLVNELNLIRDDYARANGFGVAQYASYALNDTVTLDARGELFRDDRGFFVAAFRHGRDYVRSERGLPASTIGVGPATYAALTVGATWKPTVPKSVATLLVRPELRYDQTLSNARAFNDQRHRGAFTAAVDAVLGF